MGIGTDTAKQLISSTTDRAELADAVNALNDALSAIDRGEVAAREAFIASKPVEFAQVRGIEVAKKLAELEPATIEEAVVEATK